MSSDTISGLTKFSRKMAQAESVQFAVAGGDPTAHPKYTEIASQLAAIAPTTIVTHGCNLEKSDLFFLANLDDFQIQFSIPSLNDDYFKHITGGACLRTTLQNLARCVSLSIPVSISSVVSEDSIGTEHASEIIALAKAANVPRVIFNRFLPAGRGALYDDELSLLENDFNEYVGSAKERMSACDVEVYISEEMAQVRDAKIINPKLNVCYDGKIKACSMANASIGSIDDTIECVMDNYVNFWGGGSTDEGCTCSQFG